MQTTKTFLYEAIDAKGATVKGKIDSDSADSAAASLANQFLIPMSLKVTGTGMQKDIKIPGLGGRTSLKDLAILSRQFASMTSSGLTLLRSLGILEDQTVKPKLKEAIVQVRADVQEGSTLSDAMSKHPEQFPLLMVNMISAGEAGGFLDDALARIARMYEADANLRAKIKSAMTYPVIVLLLSLLLCTGVIVFIVPVFTKIFKYLGGKLPLPTQIMVDLSNNIEWVLPTVLIAKFVGLRAYRKATRESKAYRLTMDRLKLRLPVSGTLFTKRAISLWSSNLGNLLGV